LTVNGIYIPTNPVCSWWRGENTWVAARVKTHWPAAAFLDTLAITVKIPPRAESVSENYEGRMGVGGWPPGPRPRSPTAVPLGIFRQAL